MELRIKVDDAFIRDLTAKLEGKQLGEVTGTRLAQDALALFKWAVDETSNGRVVVSTSPTGDDVHRVVMPALSGVAPQ
jgi:hypothetical protein